MMLYMQYNYTYSISCFSALSNSYSLNNYSEIILTSKTNVTPLPLSSSSFDGIGNSIQNLTKQSVEF